MGRMHAGNLETSDRLQKLDAFLRLRGQRGATSIEITDLLRAAAASTDVSELRRNLRRSGEDVTCTSEGRTADGRKIFRYRIEALKNHSSSPESRVTEAPLEQPDVQLRQGDLFGRTG